MGKIVDIAKYMPIHHNVSIRVVDSVTGKVVQEHTGHNSATNSMLVGMGHYLIGDGVLGQGYHMLDTYLPKYISLGTMGLISQDEDENGLPAGIGVELGTEEERFIQYMKQCPGFGADGYDPNENNNRPYLGLGPAYADRPDPNKTVNCELVSDSFLRAPITFRDIVPEAEAEVPKTIDIIFSAMISTGALKQFRESGRNYIFITEAGLWSDKKYRSGGDNGLLAGYRIVPPSSANWYMGFEENREILKRNILRVGLNQVVQVTWKIQLGSIDQLVKTIGDEHDLVYYDQYYDDPGPTPIGGIIYRDDFVEGSTVPSGDVHYEYIFDN